MNFNRAKLLGLEGELSDLKLLQQEAKLLSRVEETVGRRDCQDRGRHVIV